MTNLLAEVRVAASQAGCDAGPPWQDWLAHFPTFLFQNVASCSRRSQGATRAAPTLFHPKHNEYLHPGGLGTKARREQSGGSGRLFDSVDEAGRI
jgi:hypothetical protein